MSDLSTDEPPKRAARPGEFVFMALFFAAAVYLLTQLGTETKFSSKGKLFAQPAFWPGVSVIGMVVFGGLHLVTSFKTRNRENPWLEMFTWARAIEFLIWFMVYVIAVPRIGYLPATLIFTTLFALRMGYRGVKTVGLATLSGLAIVLVFKTFLSVKIPGGAIYEYLPDALRNFLTIYF